LFKYSFTFKKLDQIYTYRSFIKNGSFKSEISENMIKSSVDITKQIFKQFRKVISKDTIFFSVNCASTKNNHLSKYWKKIVNEINGIVIETPSNKILELNSKDIDVFHEDGGHLNNYGNKIYGQLISEEIMIRLSDL